MSTIKGVKEKNREISVGFVYRVVEPVYGVPAIMLKICNTNFIQIDVSTTLAVGAFHTKLTSLPHWLLVHSTQN